MTAGLPGDSPGPRSAVGVAWCGGRQGTARQLGGTEFSRSRSPFENRPAYSLSNHMGLTGVFIMRTHGLGPVGPGRVALRISRFLGILGWKGQEPPGRLEYPSIANAPCVRAQSVGRAIPGLDRLRRAPRARGDFRGVRRGEVEVHDAETPMSGCEPVSRTGQTLEVVDETTYPGPLLGAECFLSVRPST